MGVSTESMRKHIEKLKEQKKNKIIEKNKLIKDIQDLDDMIETLTEVYQTEE